MEGPWRVLVGAGLLLSVLHTGSAMRCSRENIWGQTEHFFCPDAGNAEDRFCCGFGDNKYCCSTPTDEELLEDIVEKGAIGQEDGANLSPLVAILEAEQDSSSSSSTLANLKDHLNRTIKTIKEGFDGVVDRVKQKVKEKAKQKVKEKIIKSPKVPSAPVALAQVQTQPDPVVPRTVQKQEGVRSSVDHIKAKLNDTVTAAKDKVKTKIGDTVVATKDKVKAKINGTVTAAKDKAKQKVKDKVKEKATKKLDPTGGQ